MLASETGEQLKGWQWGPADGIKRWGENEVAGIENGDDPADSGSGDRRPSGELLKATFDLEAGPNEAHLSAGDSGGGLFIRDEGAWNLAGITACAAPRH